MISLGTMIEIIISIFCTVISGVILYLFNEKKKNDEEQVKKRVEADVAERELILSIAGATEVILKKLNDEELNGDVAEAEDDLVDKKAKLQKITRIDYFNSIEEER